MKRVLSLRPRCLSPIVLFGSQCEGTFTIYQCPSPRLSLRCFGRLTVQGRLEEACEMLGNIKLDVPELLDLVDGVRALLHKNVVLEKVNRSAQEVQAFQRYTATQSYFGLCLCVLLCVFPLTANGDKRVCKSLLL